MDKFSQLSDLLPDVLLEVPECPDHVALHTLNHILFKFLEKTHLWQESFSGDLVDSSPFVELDLDNFPGMIASVIRLRLKGVETDEFSNIDPLPYGNYTCTPDGVISLHSCYTPSLDIPEGAQALCACLPNVHGNQCPSWILQRYFEPLISGTIARLKASVGKPYADADGYAFHQTQYHISLTETLNSIARSHSHIQRGFYG